MASAVWGNGGTNQGWERVGERSKSMRKRARAYTSLEKERNRILKITKDVEEHIIIFKLKDHSTADKQINLSNLERSTKT